MNLQSTRKLNTGAAIPLLGLGVSKAQEGDEAVQAVLWALETGYRHIDTAAVYGNEASVGRALRESGLPRDDIFVTTKIWNTDVRAGRVREAYEESLERLGLETVDLLLLHWPVPDHYLEAWQVFESLYAEGRARAVGVSNFHVVQLEALLAQSRTVPAVNQCECHPLLSQTPLKNYCERLGIVFEAWSPLGGGSAGNLTGDRQLAALGAKHNKTAAQIILRWHLQRQTVAIPKSVRLPRIQENADLFDFQLDKAEMAEIAAMNLDRRTGANPDHFSF